MGLLSSIFKLIMTPFRIVGMFFVELLLPEPIKETMVIVSIYALFKGISDPCTLDVNKMDKEVLDLLVIPDAIKLPILCAPYIWGEHIAYIKTIKANIDNGETTFDNIREYAEDLYRKIPFYLRYNSRKSDAINAIERIICLTCDIPTSVASKVDRRVMHVPV